MKGSYSCKLLRNRVSWLSLLTLFFFASAIQAQTITSIDPDTALAGTTVNVTVMGAGTNFVQGTSALDDGVTYVLATSENIISATEYIATFDIPSNTPAGWYDYHKDSVSLSNGFYVTTCIGQCGELSGHIWDDQNGNGVQDVGEDDLAGITISVNPGGLAAVTDANGDYTIAVNDNQTYTISLPTVLFDYTCDPGTIQLAGTQTVPVGPNDYTVTLTPSTPTSNDNDFGVTVPDTTCGTISGLVWLDDNQDGVNDVSESGAFNVKVRLDEANIGDWTDASGNYSFQVFKDSTYTLDLIPPYYSQLCGSYQYGLATQTAPAANGNLTATTSSAAPSSSGNDFGLWQPVTNCGTISGTVYSDDNQNGVYDAGEQLLGSVTVNISSPNGSMWVNTNSNGVYTASVVIGPTYTVSANLNPGGYNYYCGGYQPITVTISEPVGGSYTATPTVGSPDVMNQDFGRYLTNQPAGSESWISALWPGSWGYPGGYTSGGTDFKINGFVNTTCTLSITTDPLLSLSYSSLPAFNTGPGFAEWELANNYGYNPYCIGQNWYIDSAAVPGSVYTWNAELTCDNTDACPWNNTASTGLTIFNPSRSAPALPSLNQIYQFHTGDSLTNEISVNDTTFSYIINFHNVTGEMATNVLVIDTLPDELDPATISSPFSLYPHNFCVEDNIVYFDFQNINLKDSGDVWHESYGYVQFNINTKPGLTPGTTIDNVAEIVFDNQYQYSTNTTTATIVAPDGVEEGIRLDEGLAVYPNPANSVLNVQSTNGTLTEVVLYNAMGQVVLMERGPAAFRFQLNVSDLNAGIYLLQARDGDRVVSRQVVLSE